MHHYPHHIGDYRRDTMHLTMIEHGAYRQLLDMYYLHEKPIPTETSRLFRLLCARFEEEQNAVLSVLNEFFKVDEQAKTWVHERCESEIQAYKLRAEASKENGKLGGRPKKTKQVILGYEKHNLEKGNQEPITNNQEPIKDITPLALLVSLDVDKKIAQDWLKIRKVKKMPLTETALDQIINEAKKAGLTLNQAIKKCCEESWAGFKANWMTDHPESIRKLVL